MNAQIKAWVARHSREVGFAVEALQAQGNANHANDLRESWEPVAAAIASNKRAVFTTAAPPDMPSVLDPENGVRWIVFIYREGGQAPTTVGLFSDPADAEDLYRGAGAQWSDSYLCEVVRGPHDGRRFTERRPVLTAEQARTMVEKTWREAPGSECDVDGMLDALAALLMRVAGPVTECEASMGAAFKAAERSGHTVMVAHPAMVMAAEAIRKEAEVRAVEHDSLAPYRATGVDRTTCPHDDDYRVPVSGDGWLCAVCGDDVPPPSEMATTDGEE